MEPTSVITQRKSDESASKVQLVDGERGRVRERRTADPQLTTTACILASGGALRRCRWTSSSQFWKGTAEPRGLTTTLMPQEGPACKHG